MAKKITLIIFTLVFVVGCIGAFVPTFQMEGFISFIKVFTPTFITLKISKQLNLVEMFAYKYTYNSRIPVYKLQNYHYYFDIDNPISSAKGKFNVEYIISERTQVELNDFYGWITNFKLFDLYNDNTTELLQMYPTHQHLLINDTARRIVELPGVKPA